MKILKYIGVTILLVVFPALSWYYLDTGLEYRKEAHEAMLPKEDLNELISARRFTTEFDLRATCDGMTTILISRKDDKKDATIKKLYDQFDDAFNFQMVLLNGSGLTPMAEFEKDNFHVVPAQLNYDNEIVLLDNQMRVRTNHTFEKESVQKLVSYTALLLPRTKGRDIKQRK